MWRALHTLQSPTCSRPQYKVMVVSRHNYVLVPTKWVILLAGLVVNLYSDVKMGLDGYDEEGWAAAAVMLLFSRQLPHQQLLV